MDECDRKIGTFDARHALGTDSSSLSPFPLVPVQGVSGRQTFQLSKVFLSVF
ncbi:hypothetical protein AAMO2058_000325800 [Amorphochlora amoebiformis]